MENTTNTTESNSTPSSPNSTPAATQNAILNEVSTPEETETADTQYLMRGTKLRSVAYNGKIKAWRAWLSPCKQFVCFVKANNENRKSKLELMDVIEVRITGCRTDELHKIREAMKQSDPDGIKEFEQRCFTVHRRDKERDLIHSFVANSVDDARRWVKILKVLVRRYELTIRQSPGNPAENWLKRVFRERDVHHRGYLNLQQCKKLVKEKLNVALNTYQIGCFQLNRSMHEDEHGMDEEEFIRFYQQVRSFEEQLALNHIYYVLTGFSMSTQRTLSPERLLKFLTEIQGEANFNLETVAELILTHDHAPTALSPAGFRSLMASEMFDIRKEDRVMNQPSTFALKPAAQPLCSKRVTIRIISGHNIHQGRKQINGISSPYVSVRMEGDALDCRKIKTKAVRNNGLNPNWFDEMTFNINVPELAVIHFQVKHKNKLLGLGFNSVTLGAFALPILNLASGYRRIPLQDKHGVRLPFSTLFVKVNIIDV